MTSLTSSVIELTHHSLGRRASPIARPKAAKAVSFQPSVPMAIEPCEGSLDSLSLTVDRLELDGCSKRVVSIESVTEGRIDVLLYACRGHHCSLR